MIVRYRVIGGFHVYMYTPHCLKEHDLMLCVFHLGVIFAWLL